jgi:hypothetical protein
MPGVGLLHSQLFRIGGQNEGEKIPVRSRIVVSTGCLSEDRASKKGFFSIWKCGWCGNSNLSG